MMHYQEMIENKTFDEIALEESASLSKKITLQDIESFAWVSGDYNPAHIDAEYADNSLFKGRIAHGMSGGALISAVLGTKLPGPGTIYLEQTLTFLKPVFPEDTITATVTIIEKQEKNAIIKCQCEVTNQHGNQVIKGAATVMAPVQKICRPKQSLHQDSEMKNHPATQQTGHFSSQENNHSATQH